MYVWDGVVPTRAMPCLAPGSKPHEKPAVPLEPRPDADEVLEADRDEDGRTPA